MRPRRLVALLFVLIFLGLCAAAAPRVLRAARLATAARATLINARDDVDAGRLEDARVSLAAANKDASAAHAHLRSFAPWLLGRIPLVGRPVRSAEMLIGATARATSAARAAIDVFPDRSPWERGSVDVAALKKMRSGAGRADDELQRALRSARRSPAWPLPGSVADARQELIDELGEQAATVSSTRRILDVLPEVLGAKGPRRYFVVFQNPTELRGTGGFWGNYALFTANAGRLELGGFGRPHSDLAAYATKPGPPWFESRYGGFDSSTDWRQMNFAPDFPTVASLAEADLEAAPGLGPVDGVIAVDPVGLAALLELAGPMTVPGWPEPIDATNVVRITLHDAYTAFATEQARIDFLGVVAQATWAHLSRSEVPVRPEALRGLGDAIAAKRFMFHFTRRDEQRAIAAAGADGALRGSNTFGVVTQNTAPSKLDYWLERHLSLDVRLKEHGSADVRATVAIRNGASGVGEPTYVTGSTTELFKAGWVQQFVSLYVPRRAIDKGGGDDTPVGAEEDPGFATASTFIDVGPLDERAMRARFTVSKIWDSKTGVLTLRVRRQPALLADDVELAIAQPPGWRLQPQPGFSVRKGRGVWRGKLDRDLNLVVKLTRDG